MSVELIFAVAVGVVAVPCARARAQLDRNVLSQWDAKIISLAWDRWQDILDGSGQVKCPYSCSLAWYVYVYNCHVYTSF